jgi:F-type H+-transporting ATPase subunit b
MNKLTPPLLTLLALAPVALAAGPDGGKASDQQGLIATVNQGVVAGVVAVVLFLLVFAVLSIAVWPKISKGLADREDKIRHEIESAEAARVQAKMALDQYEKSLAEARAEAQKMIDAAKGQMSAQVAEMKAKADADVATMKAKAMTEIEAAKKQALSDIYAHSSQLATQVAGKILRREVGQGDTQRLVDEALAGMTRN